MFFLWQLDVATVLSPWSQVFKGESTHPSFLAATMMMSEGSTGMLKLPRCVHSSMMPRMNCNTSQVSASFTGTYGSNLTSLVLTACLGRIPTGVTSGRNTRDLDLRYPTRTFFEAVSFCCGCLDPDRPREWRRFSLGRDKLSPPPPDATLCGVKLSCSCVLLVFFSDSLITVSCFWSSISCCTCDRLLGNSRANSCPTSW